MGYTIFRHTQISVGNIGALKIEVPSSAPHVLGPVLPILALPSRCPLGPLGPMWDRLGTDARASNMATRIGIHVKQ